MVANPPTDCTAAVRIANRGGSHAVPRRFARCAVAVRTLYRGGTVYITELLRVIQKRQGRLPLSLRRPAFVKETFSRNFFGILTKGCCIVSDCRYNRGMGSNNADNRKGETMKTKTYTIDDLANEFARLNPSDVYGEPNGQGYETETGYQGYDGETDEYGDYWTPHVSFFAEHGNTGHPVMSIHEEDIHEAVERLKALPDGADEKGLVIEKALAGLRVEWHV